MRKLLVLLCLAGFCFAGDFVKVETVMARVASCCPKPGLTLLERRKVCCDSRDGAGYCIGVGELYENGEGVKKDIDKALEFYGKACDMKEQLGCENFERLKNSK